MAGPCRYASYQTNGRANEGAEDIEGMAFQARRGSYDRAQHHYGQLAMMTALSFIAMFILMYAMVDLFANVYSNINQFYMARLMTALMIITDSFVMPAMYPDMKMNLIFGSVAVSASVLFLRRPRPDGGWRRPARR